MEKKKLIYILISHRYQIVSGIVMISAGLLTGAAAKRSPAFFPQPPAAAAIAVQLATPTEAAQPRAVLYPATVAEATPAEPAAVRLPDRLNLAYMTAEGREGGPGAGSIAQQLNEELASREAKWTSEIYDLYNQNPIDLSTRDPAQNPLDPSVWVVPEFKNIHVTFLDGNGVSGPGRSNLKEIIAMASVYNDYGNAGTLEELKEYVLDLWEASHSYSYQISPVYYCDGCQEADSANTEESGVASGAADVGTPAEASVASAEAIPEGNGPALESEAETTAPENTEKIIVEGVDGGPGVSAPLTEETGVSPEENPPVTCPGHVDLAVQITIAGIDGNGSLFMRDKHGAASSGGASNWPGWNDETMGYVRTICSQDWFDEYGLTVTDLVVRNPLTTEDIGLYMDMVPLEASKTRKDLVRFALTSVGRVPYYWGGKPGRAGYESNQFGIVVSPDEDGRFLKGLDCSGWVSWVYWSATGSRLPGDSTVNQIRCGTAISKEDLQPGDICIRLGSKAHTVMFLGWTNDGQMRCIQETSGNINNVEVGVCTADWPYYRRLVD